MKLENSTPLPANLSVAELPSSQNRIGVLTAKATFRFDRNGQVQLDSQDPFPLLYEDKPTTLGPLPTDSRARCGDKFEVMLLGNAYPARKGMAISNVALTVGTERRELLVFGERVWVGDDPKRCTMSTPKPFDRMPLIYDHSFGGSVPVHIDNSSVLDISHSINPGGKGFDALPIAQALCKMLQAPKGFPILPKAPRVLPNLENPRNPIAHWDDEPDPVGWAPAPPESAISFLKLIRERTHIVKKMQESGTYSPDKFKNDQNLHTKGGDDPDLWLYRAHPDWVIELPKAGARIRMENLLNNTPCIDLKLPQLRVVADYTIYGRTGKRDLRPQILVLLPEEQRFYLVYRLPFNFEPGPAHERSFRLRIEKGWLNN